MENNVAHRYIQVNDVRIGVIQQDTTRPEQPTLVLLHGFTGSAANWLPLIAQFATYNLHCIALDLPGHGQSDAPDTPERYSMEHCQTDILTALQQLEVGQGEAILLGYSMGGRIALYSAFSGYFRALILESASPGLSDPLEGVQRRQSDEKLATRIEQHGIPAFVDYWEQLPLFSSQLTLPDEQRSKLRQQRLNNRPNGLANSLRGMGTGAQPALHDQLPNLTLPILLMAGELDSKFCDIARQMSQVLPHAQLQIVPAAGHTIHLEQPELFVKLVGEFCSRVL